ncbi:MAG: tRNA pseudouridine(55) synthase TruB [Clostridia bacterium]|nr:tRNA pseudouridine(55) synthase TruB [Clostridia bacterium]
MTEQMAFTEPDGVLVVNKHQGPTSHDIVGKIRKLYNTKKVGHTGTLDPLATGVLVVLIGRAAKAAEYLISDEKIYRATLRLGIETDTEDITGKAIREYDGSFPSEEEVINASNSFLGKSLQIPPMYSALKIGGKKLVDLAREGIEIERNGRPIEIFSISCDKIDEKNYSLDVHSSGGTYIRSLCRDIGNLLGCGGCMATLCRTKTGGFPISQSVTIDELEKMSYSERLSKLIPTESLFFSLPMVKLPAFYEKLCRSGCEIYQKKLKTNYDTGTRVRLCSEDGEFFALGEVRDFENGSAIKSIKTFKL